MSEGARLAVAILATFRLAAALYYERGPFDVWLRLRWLAQRRSAFWQEQLSCFWCCTAWAGLVVWGLYVWCAWVLVPVALSGAAVLLAHGGRIVWTEMREG